MKNYLTSFIILNYFLFSFSPSNLFASVAGGIGKVVLLKGEVHQTIGNKQKLLKEGDSIDEGGVIKTGKTGSIKIFLQDQTVLSLGTNSILNLDEVKDRKVPNINLVEGQIRAKVMKNLIASAMATHQVKFIVRTKTAAMGVRGTDFEVVYNPENKVTSLVTFEGAVAMIKTDPNEPSSASQTSNLVPLLTSASAVVVTEGRFSSANPVLPQATLPVKISPAQFESLKRTDPSARNEPNSTGNANAASAPSKSFISPIPPGVDPKSFASTSSSLEKQVSSALGISSPDSSKSQISANGGPNAASGATPPNAPSAVNGFPIAPAPPPEGQYNAKTGAYAPPAGGFLDLKSGLYIPPPPGSSYDANTGVYNPPAAMGKFDSVNGGYVPPKDFQLDAKQGLIPVSSPSTNLSNPSNETSIASAQGNGARSPASANAPSAAGAGPSIVPGFSALNGGQGTTSNPSGTMTTAGGGLPILGVPGMPGGVLPGLPGGNGNAGYGAPIAINLPLPPPPPQAVFIPNIPAGRDPACPNCAPPPPPPSTILPASTKVTFSFTFINNPP